MERIINNRLKWFIDAHHLLSKLQPRFHQGCSTSGQISSLEIQIMNGFRQNWVNASAFHDLTEYLVGWTVGQAHTVWLLWNHTNMVKEFDYWKINVCPH